MNYGGRRDKPDTPRPDSPKAHRSQVLKSVDVSMTTAQRLVSRLDNSASEYYKDIINKTDFTLLLSKLENTTVLELAQILEDGLLHSCLLREDMPVSEFLKMYFGGDRR